MLSYSHTGFLVLPVLLLTPVPSPATDLFVNNRDAACTGREPCFPSIQQAVAAARPGDRVQIQPGVYREYLRVQKKNDFPGAGETDRIAIGPADGAPLDSVILAGRKAGGGCRTGAVQVESSRRVTIHGLVITGFHGPAIRLRGRSKDNVAVHIERNRIFDNGGRECDGGIVIEHGNAGTVVVNNLVYANGGDGIGLGADEGAGVPGSESDGDAGHESDERHGSPAGRSSGPHEGRL